MRILFLDTETNGLPKNRYASFKMTEAWPTIVQLAWQVWEFPDIKIYESSFLLQPTDPWNAESAKIHGITEEVARTHGLPTSSVLRSFASDAAECDIVVAHNLAFDKPVLLAAAHRLGMSTEWWPAREICTMQATKDVCKIPSKFPKPTDPYKWPQLAEVWATLFPASPLPTGLHNAAQDVAVLVTCFQELVRSGFLVLPLAPLATRRDRFTDFFRRVLAILVP